MYDRFRNQYIFKLSNGRTINIFYKENSGLCVSMLNKRNMWTESTIIAKDSQRGFCADIDKNDNIHILYQDAKGNLSTIVYSDSEYKNKPLLSSKSITPYDKNLSIISTVNGIVYLYVIEYNGRKLLSYQCTHNDLSVTQPKVIDYCSDSKLPYTCFMDSQGCIVVFYYCVDERHKGPGIKVINIEKDSLSDFMPVTNIPDCTAILSGFYDAEGNCSLLWERKREGKFELCYNSKAYDSDSFDTEQCITTSAYPHTNSSILGNSSIAICYWTSDNSIFYTASTDRKHFNSAEKYNLFDARPFYCITYKTNTLDRNSYISGFAVPANFSNGYKLGFTDIISAKTRTASRNSDDTSSLVSKQSIDAAYENYSKLSDKIQNLENRIGKIELDLQKSIIKIEFLENEVKKNKKNYSSTMIDSQDSAKDKISQKSSFSMNDNLTESFKYLEKKFDDDNFIQDPRIEEIKKEISKTSNIKNSAPVILDELKPQNSVISASASTNTPQKSNNPIMPGSGFSSITPEYLKSLGKKAN